MATNSPAAEQGALGKVAEELSRERRSATRKPAQQCGWHALRALAGQAEPIPRPLRTQATSRSCLSQSRSVVFTTAPMLEDTM